MAGQVLSAQRTVNLLRASSALERGTVAREDAVPTAESFTFDRNLIFFEAMVDGAPGKFILDTGAPTLVMNTRGQAAAGSNYTGYGSGGEVALSDHRVAQFEMVGRTIENYWAIGLDLRNMERRVGQRIDGMVGYELLNDGELRIDYANRSFRLLPSERSPTHGQATPRAVLRFSLVDHLPIVRIRIEGKRYNFAIDTGAGSNLVDESVARELALEPTGGAMNIQGLDGRAVEASIFSLPTPEEFDGGERDISLVAMDLSHLRENGRELAGILGSAFLSQYTVGIDYRRRRIYIW
ncbi:pepsin/retropepsin-like aspartic protease family protein [Lewinella sp. IMCC34191]|uniref:pepsin/retropepsin-like aspartic protease family protein n=1 Tax=Lewinella sp. IMCC34191 TaxID=2259172 RepID=UPI0018E4E3AE|nr:pepsin/retropepsin-like aspartic protease family protein [Lewinella sp. IMCC34191]